MSINYEAIDALFAKKKQLEGYEVAINHYKRILEEANKQGSQHALDIDLPLVLNSLANSRAHLINEMKVTFGVVFPARDEEKNFTLPKALKGKFIDKEV